jgi:uncharacterized circularly permuted ATP-grasp superfamily protein
MPTKVQTATAKANEKAAKAARSKAQPFAGYELDGFFDEVFASPGQVRRGYRRLVQRLNKLSARQLDERRQMADVSFLNQGITFTVYSDNQGTDEVKQPTWTMR